MQICRRGIYLDMYLHKYNFLLAIFILDRPKFVLGYSPFREDKIIYFSGRSDPRRVVFHHFNPRRIYKYFFIKTRGTEFNQILTQRSLRKNSRGGRQTSNRLRETCKWVRNATFFKYCPCNNIMFSKLRKNQLSFCNIFHFFFLKEEKIGL